MNRNPLAHLLQKQLEGPAGELLSEIVLHYRRWQAGVELMSAYPYIRKLLKLREIALVQLTARQCLNLIELGARVGPSYAGELWLLFRWDLSAMSRLVDLDVLDVNARFLTCPPLFLAAREGSAKLCSKLLAAGAKPNPKGIVAWNSSPLEEAAYWGNTEYVRTLLAGGAKPRGMKPLAVAAMLGQMKECRKLLRAGASPAGAGQRMTPLFLAAAHGHTKVVRLLLEAGAPPGNPHSSQDLTPLQVAAQHGYHQVVQLLLAAGAEPESAHYVEPPLVLAAQGCRRMTKATNYKEVCELLLRAGARVNGVCGGNTALHHAAHNANFPVCELLMQAGANVNTQDTIGRTPLHVAACNLFNKDFSAEQYACFLRHGGDESIRDNRGITPRECREEWDPKPSFGLVERLLRDRILQPEAEEAPLRELSLAFLHHFEQAQQGAEDMRAFPYIAALIRCGRLAYRHLIGCEDIEELLNMGADPSQPLPQDGNTPLHECLDPLLCNKLLAAGADPHARNAAGLTPADLLRPHASSAWNNTILELLS